MPATNDANEGALGSYRVRMRDFPSVTLHQYNAEAMFRQNDTQDFIDAVFLPEDHLFIMREGRRIDASGLEVARHKELADFRIRVAQLKQEKILAAQRKAAEEIRRRILLPLVTSLEGIPKLTIPELKDQLQILRTRGVRNILANSKYARKADKVKALEVFWVIFMATPEAYPLPPLPPLLLASETVVVDDWEVRDNAEMDVET